MPVLNAHPGIWILFFETLPSPVWLIPGLGLLLTTGTELSCLVPVSYTHLVNDITMLYLLHVSITLSSLTAVSYTHLLTENHLNFLVVSDNALHLQEQW